MNIKTTLGLVLLLVIVGVFYFVLSRQQGGGTTVSAEGIGLFSVDQFPLQSTESITIERAGELVEMVKTDGKWFQTKPVRFAINQWDAEQNILNATGRLRYTTRALPGERDFPTLDEIDLDPPLATITFKFAEKDSRTRKLHLGKRVGQYAYVMVDNDPHVYVVDKTIYDHVVEKNAGDWRAKTVQLPKESLAQRVAITTDDSTIILEKDNSRWSLIGELSGRADRLKVRAYLDAMASLPIERFVADNPDQLSRYGLDDPVLSLQIASPDLTTEDSIDLQIKTLHIGSPVDLSETSYFATIQQHTSHDSNQSADTIVFQISRDSFDRLNADTDQFRDARITVAAPADVRKIELVQGDQPQVVLSKEPDGWVYFHPQMDYSPDYTAVTELLDELANARAEAYGSVAQLESDLPIADVILTAIGRNEPEHLRIFNSDAQDGYFVVRNNEPTAYLLAKNALQLALAQPVVFRERDILEIKPQSVSSMTVDKPDGTVYEFITLDPVEGQPDQRPWRLKSGEKYEVDARRALLNHLTSFRAEAWEAGTAVEGTTIILDTNSEQSYTFHFDTQTLRGSAEHLPGGVFVFDSQLAQLIDAEMRDRTLLPYTIGEIHSVTVNAGVETATAINANGEYVDVDGNLLNQQAAGALFDAFAPLRIRRYINPGSYQADDAAASVQIQIKSGQSYILHIIPRIRQTSIVTITPAFGDHRDWFELDESTTNKILAKLQ